MWWMVGVAAAFTLEEAWTAAEQGPELSASAAGAERARATVGLARAGLLPKLALDGSWTWNDEAIALDLGAVLPPEVTALTGPIPPFVVQQKEWFQASATLIVPLVDADAWATVRGVGAGADAAELEVEVARQQVRIAVARAFHGTLLARDAVAIAEEAVRVAGRHEEAARARVAAGDAPPRVALEAEQARLAAERDVLGSRESLVRAEEALRRFTGIAPGSPLEESPVARPASVGERPEQRAAALRVDAAREARAATALAWVPDVTGRLTALVTENAGFAPDDTFLVGTLQASWVLDGGAKSARAREASAAHRQAVAAREGVNRRVAEEVRGAWASLERADAAVRAASREREAAAARLREAELAFAQGAIPFLEVSRANLGYTASALAEQVERRAADQAAVELAVWAGS